MGGQALGGGLGLLGHSRGLTSDQMVAAEVVLADGRVVECDERSHEDLCWALRGAGAQGLGVVTRLTLRTRWPHVGESPANEANPSREGGPLHQLRRGP
jgi:FAD/FMN-containing dehydrogenase